MLVLALYKVTVRRDFVGKVVKYSSQFVLESFSTDWVMNELRNHFKHFWAGAVTKWWLVFMWQILKVWLGVWRDV